MKNTKLASVFVWLSISLAIMLSQSVAAQTGTGTKSKRTPRLEKERTGQPSDRTKTPETPSTYDPLKTVEGEIKTLELTVKDSERSRKVPALIYLPKSTKPTAVIVHSHGLGGTKNTSPFLGKHWAARGYVAVFVQHPGSDDSVWKDIPRLQILKAMKKAANADNLLLRIADVGVVIDQLEKWNVEKAHPLFGRLDLKHLGMSGHSFGAVTTQYVSGLTTGGEQQGLDKRISAAIPMSPSSPKTGSAKDAFSKVAIPWLCMTGTKDKSIIGGADMESRLAVYTALPDGDKYELVLFEAEHSVFTEQSERRRRNQRNPNHHVSIKAITTAFWDTYLREDKVAEGWLNSDSVRSVLETKDRWQKK